MVALFSLSVKVFPSVLGALVVDCEIVKLLSFDEGCCCSVVSGLEVLVLIVTVEARVDEEGEGELVSSA